MAETIVGCSGGSWFRIDPATGVGTFVGSTGFGSLNSLARHPSGTMYSSDAQRLIKIDPQTGVGTIVTTLNPTTGVRGLAFSPSGVLYGIRNGGPGGSVVDPDELVRINVATGG